MSTSRCDTPGKMRLLVRFAADGPRWLAALTGDQVGYSLAQSMWRHDDDLGPQQLCHVHAAFVGERVALALVTDLSGDLCDFARSHHTNCTRMANHLNDRPSGTVWNNTGLHAAEVVGWEGVLKAIGMIAAFAAYENGTDDPYESETFFGPALWGAQTPYLLPERALSDRSCLPACATLVLGEPDVRPLHLSRAELVHEAEAVIDIEVARMYAELPVPANPRKIRPFHARRHRPDPATKVVETPWFIGPEDLVAAAEQEDDLWHDHYHQCRREFPEHQEVAFPAGTIRFRRLGAGCDPLEPHRRAPCPPRSKPLPPCLPPTEADTDRAPPS